MTKTEYNKQYYQNHRARLCAHQREWRAKNVETVILKDRARYVRDREKKLASKKARYHLHRESKRAYNRAYYAANINRFKANSKQWRNRNGDRIRHLNNLYRYQHPEKAKQWNKKSRQKNKSALVAADARRRALELKAETCPATDAFYEFVHAQGIVNCSYCGLIMSGKDAHIDHIVPLTRGGTHLPGNLCVSCKPCNSSKGNKLLSEWHGKTFAALFKERGIPTKD